MRLAIDTNRYVDFAKGVPEPVERLRRAMTGARRGEENEAMLVRFLDSPRVDLVFADEETTHHYARLFYQLRRQGLKARPLVDAARGTQLRGPQIGLGLLEPRPRVRRHPRHDATMPRLPGRTKARVTSPAAVEGRERGERRQPPRVAGQSAVCGVSTSVTTGLREVVSLAFQPLRSRPRPGRTGGHHRWRVLGDLRREVARRRE